MSQRSLQEGATDYRIKDLLSSGSQLSFLTFLAYFFGDQLKINKKNYNSKKEDNKEKDQREDERNVIL